MDAVPPTELLGPLNEVERQYAPKLFWYVGDPNLARVGARVAVVGTREVSPEGQKRTERLVRYLVQHRVTIVSGLAEGVDTVAHTTAMFHGGRTIAVIGTGIDTAFPRSNASLQAAIARDHLLVSQFAPSVGVSKRQFPQRNRTMALLSHATVITEAGDGSGTLSQAWECLRLGRPLFVLRSVVQNEKLTWPAEVMAYGAIELVEPEQLLPALPLGRGGAQLAF